MVRSPDVIWSFDAEKDLKKIHLFCSKQDVHYASRVISEIIGSSKKLIYSNQYQEDEYLGFPYRRYFVKHWRIIYKVENNLIFIMRIFDIRQSPDQIR